MDAHSVQFLATSAVDLEALEAWADEPDVCEGDVGELTAPLSGDADAAAEGHDGVAKTLPALETFVGVLPDAVHRLDLIGLTEDIFPANLMKEGSNVLLHLSFKCHFFIQKYII